MAASKNRLDVELTARGLARSRSQAESYIKLGEVKVDGQVVTKPGYPVGPQAKVELTAVEQYVSRAALKLASVAQQFNLDFRGKVVLDVGSSTGGFTEYALRHGAERVIAVEVGRDQLHPSLRDNPHIELHEQTDIRDVRELSSPPDIVVADVSFISLREILPHVAGLCRPQTQLVVMVKPQFEAQQSQQKHKGVIKNDAMRRGILKDFEVWAREHGFVVRDKADSAVSGAKGNRERFYLLMIH
ncbi:MAG TPA: TlyA family RNA methyltransferase [Candidatus Saccharimonadales bacterium]|nr:TlyA family RNA methyltransferase [Candidatus Saccharimonadales bacterium]